MMLRHFSRSTSSKARKLIELEIKQQRSKDGWMVAKAKEGTRQYEVGLIAVLEYNIYIYIYTI